MQRGNGRQTDNGGAVRIGDKTVPGEGILGVDFGDDERHIIVETEGARIVHDQNALFGCTGQVHLGDIVVGGAERNIQPLKGFLTRELHFDIFVFELEFFAGRAFTAEQTQFFDREFALGEHNHHLLTDSARGAQNADV